MSTCTDLITCIAGNDMPNSQFTGERAPLHGPLATMLALPANQQYLKYPLHAIVATQPLSTEELYLRATFFRALEDLGVRCLQSVGLSVSRSLICSVNQICPRPARGSQCDSVYDGQCDSERGSEHDSVSVELTVILGTFTRKYQIAAVNSL